MSIDLEPASDENLTREIFNELWYKFFTQGDRKEVRIPIMGHKELDLYRLYSTREKCLGFLACARVQVVSFGGYEEVMKNTGTWSKIWKAIPNFDPTITDSSYRLRRNYEKYLLDFERRHYAVSSSDESSSGTADRLPESYDSAIMTRLRAQMIRETAGIAHPESRPQTASTRSLSSQAKRSRVWQGRRSSISIEDTDSVDDSHSSRQTASISSSRSSSPAVSPVPDRSMRANVNVGEVNATSSPGTSVSDVAIVSLGYVVPRAPYVTVDGNIWPICFHSRRPMYSMRFKGSVTVYDCTITDSTHGPLFSVSARDDPGNVLRSLNPDDCWKSVLDASTDLFLRSIVSNTIGTKGRSFFGLENPQVVLSLNIALAQARLNAMMETRFGQVHHLFQVPQYTTGNLWNSHEHLKLAPLKLTEDLNVPPVSVKPAQHASEKLNSSSKSIKKRKRTDENVAPPAKRARTAEEVDAAAQLLVLFGQ